MRIDPLLNVALKETGGYRIRECSPYPRPHTDEHSSVQDGAPPLTGTRGEGEQGGADNSLRMDLRH